MEHQQQQAEKPAMTTAEATVLAKKMHAAGKTYAAIAHQLKIGGYKRLRSKRPIDAQAVNYLLHGIDSWAERKKKAATPANPIYVKVDGNKKQEEEEEEYETPLFREKKAAPAPAPAPAPALDDSMVVIIARPGQLRSILGDLVK